MPKQTIIVKKAIAPTRKEAEKIARRFADRIYTSRYDKRIKAWRFRQRPPDCFVEENSYGQKCIPLRGVKNSVCIVYARLKRGAAKRRACR